MPRLPAQPGIDRRGLLAGAGAGLTLMGGQSAWAAPAPTPTVETAQGRLSGLKLDGVDTFKGVRYGASTVGQNRFLPPKQPPSWAGVQDAIKLGDMSPQVPGDYSAPDLKVYWPVPNPPEGMSEDCLVLNVWTPQATRAAKRPVMVWLHGGGYGSGSDGPYDLLQLAKFGDVVTVGVNHRLNMFGYIYLAGLGDPRFAEAANVGQLDIVAALAWVRQNIEAFGGDPGNVTIFGQSGGGGKVSTLMAMPAAKGLFHKAIVQSGSGLRSMTAEEGARSADAIVKNLGLTAPRLEALQTLSMEALIAAMRATRPRLAPVMDGRTLPRHPFDPDAPPISAEVPMIIGTNETETTILSPRTVDLFSLEESALNDQVKALIQVDDARAEGLIANYRADHPRATPADLIFLITTDRRFRQNAIWQAERKAAQARAPAYLYLLSYKTPILGGKLRSPHNLEIPFVFHDVDNKLDANTGDNPDRYRLQDQMAGAWVAFARTGNPNHTGLPDWPAYDATTRATMIFDAESRVVNDPGGAQRRALEALPLVSIV